MRRLSRILRSNLELPAVSIVKSESEMLCEKSEKEKDNIHLYEFLVADIILLAKIIFQHNCFSWRRNFYQQLRGLAMGNWLALILAILYMDRIENQAIYLSLFISFYYRYIDDCITPARNHEEAVCLFKNK